MRVWAVAAAAALVAAGGASAEPASQTLRLRNDAGRLVRCTLLVDGRYFTDLTFKPGQAYARDFAPTRDLRLVCVKARKAFGPLALGTAYTFVHEAGRVGLTAGDGEP
jgi:hypothetical protein